MAQPKKNAGRPELKTKEIIAKIEEAAALGASVEEIAFFCGIGKRTLYRWMEEDAELKARIEELWEKPILKARLTVIKGLGKIQNAQWYLERKKKKEFSQRTEQDITSGGEKITLNQECRDASDLAIKVFLAGKKSKKP